MIYTVLDAEDSLKIPHTTCWSIMHIMSAHKHFWL